MNLSADIKNWKLIVVAGVLALPLFIFLNGTSVSLPESYFRPSGIPVHANALLFLLLPKRILMNPKELIFLLAFLIYCIISLLQSVERFQLTIQIGYFIYGYKILSGLTENNIRSLDKYLAIFATLLISAHAASLGLAALSGDLFSSAAKGIFGFIIYQSHLTYPVVIVLLLVSVSRSFQKWNILRIFVILMALLIEVVLMRRVGLGLFLIFLLLFERRCLVLLFFSCLMGFIAFTEAIVAFLRSSSFVERLTQLTNDGVFTRAMTWERTLERLNDPSTLLLGNGLNNHSHNFFLHTLSTHGLIISILFFTLIGFWIFKNIVKNGSINSCSILAFVVVVVDWNLNVNLYQPYYSLMFAFFLISNTRIVSNVHIEK